MVQKNSRTHHSQSLCSICRGLKIQTYDEEPAAKESKKTSIPRSAANEKCKAQQWAQVRVTSLR